MTAAVNCAVTDPTDRSDAGELGFDQVSHGDLLHRLVAAVVVMRVPCRKQEITASLLTMARSFGR